jgi:hypothetical protein
MEQSGAWEGKAEVPYTGAGKSLTDLVRSQDSVIEVTSQRPYTREYK